MQEIFLLPQSRHNKMWWHDCKTGQTAEVSPVSHLCSKKKANIFMGLVLRFGAICRRGWAPSMSFNNPIKGWCWLGLRDCSSLSAAFQQDFKAIEAEDDINLFQGENIGIPPFQIPCDIDHLDMLLIWRLLVSRSSAVLRFWKFLCCEMINFSVSITLHRDEAS